MHELVLGLLSRAVGLLPWPWLRAVGAALGWFAGSVLRIRRAHVETAMRRAGVAHPSGIARAMYASLGTSVFEFLWMVGRGKSSRLATSLTPRAETALRQHASRGAVIATAHTGNWDLVACSAAGHNLPLAVMTARLSVRFLDRFWQRERASRNVELISGEAMFSRALATIGRNKSVAVLIDQAPLHASATVTDAFLGCRARCDVTAALLAARARVPMIVAFGRREKAGSHVIDVPLVLTPPERPSLGWAFEATRLANRALDVFVQENPAQWLWLHKRWKELPARKTARALTGVAAAGTVC